MFPVQKIFIALGSSVNFLNFFTLRANKSMYDDSFREKALFVVWPVPAADQQMELELHGK